MRMRWNAFTTLIVVALFAQLAAGPTPAAAQFLPPSRNAISGSLATFTPTLFTVGASIPLALPWDLTVAYSAQSFAGITVSLTTIGARYFFSMPGSRANPFLGAGFASAGGVSGLYLGGGLSFPLAERLNGYVTGTFASLGGVSNTIVDLGAQIRVTPQFQANIGFVSFTGSSAPYIGFTYHLR